MNFKNVKYLRCLEFNFQTFALTPLLVQIVFLLTSDFKTHTDFADHNACDAFRHKYVPLVEYNQHKLGDYFIPYIH